MKNIKSIIPTFFTSGNMLCGFLSIFFSLDGDFEISTWLILLAGFLDGLDGKLAQILKTTSQFGIRLDSLADFISFGIAPAILFYFFGYLVLGKWIWIIVFVFVAGGTFRLIRFNLRAEFENKEFFNGLPITASAITIASYFVFSQRVWGKVHPESLIVIFVLLFLLMISNIKYDNLPKFSFDNGWNRIKLLYVFAGATVMIIDFRLFLFPLSLVYICSGLVRKILSLFLTNKIRIN